MSDEPHVTVGAEAEAAVEAASPGAPEAEPAAPEAAPPNELDLRVAEAEAARDATLDRLQRLAADFDNYRKRTLRDQELAVAHSVERLVAKLLPVLDDLERALDAAEHHEEAQVLQGVRMTKDALAAVLSSEGIEEIEADGAFDPHVHEALLVQPAEDAAPGTILQVVQRGYRRGNAVLRPSRVIVAE